VLFVSSPLPPYSSSYTTSLFALKFAKEVL
jgi:hypothetical protein